MKILDKVTQVGLDVHRTFSIASLRDGSGQVLSQQRLEHLDRTKLREKISSWPPRTPVVLEGTYGWGWMSDELLSLDMDVHLASGNKTAAWRKSRGMAKSNRLDANFLSELWNERSTMKNGRVHRWWEVWLAPKEVRDQRELLRHRMGLVATQTRVKNRIHATLHRHGIISECSDLFGTAGRVFLSQLVEDTQSLRATARFTLKAQLKQLDMLRQQIAQATREFRRQLRRCEAGQRLMTIPGISTVLSYTITAEIGDIRRFPNARSLLRYSILAPVAKDSGEDRDGKPVGRRLGRAGRKTLQWALIQAAHSAVRKDKVLADVFNRRTNNGEVDRNRGYIAVANRMCRIAFAMWKNQTNYQTTPPARPGSKTDLKANPATPIESKREESMNEVSQKGITQGADDRKKSKRITKMNSTRSGTGQPNHPMVPCTQQ